MFQENRF